MRNMMYRAYELGMAEPEYAFFYYTLHPNDFIQQPWRYGANVSDEEMTKRKASFMSLKMVRYPSWIHLSTDEKEPWCRTDWQIKILGAGRGGAEKISYDSNRANSRFQTDEF